MCGARCPVSGCWPSCTCLSVLSYPICPVCAVGVLWPNGWTDQDEIWHAVRPRPRPHCVSSSSQKGAQPPFSAHVCCSQTAGWIKMPLGMEIGLSLDGDPVPLQQGGHSLPIFGACLLWPNGWMDQDATWYGGRLRPRLLVLDGDPAHLPKSCTAPPIFRPMSVVVQRLDGLRCHLVRR